MIALRALLLPLATLVCATALAADIAATYPAGAIKTREQAEEALAAVRAAEKTAEAAHREELERCAKKFLQNQCTHDARRRFDAQLREIRRVEVEARDVRRRIDADERAARRAQAEANRKAADGPSPLRDGAAQASDEEKAAANRAQYEARQKAHEAAEKERLRREAAEAEQRAAGVKAYEEKQRDAAAYAKRKEEERIANEKRREERRIERERKQKELEAQNKR